MEKEKMCQSLIGRVATEKYEEECREIPGVNPL